jgi:hypothetical protein
VVFGSHGQLFGFDGVSAVLGDPAAQFGDPASSAANFVS